MEAVEHDTERRIDDLRRRARAYRDRYGDVEELAALDRLDSSIAGRRSRLDQLRRDAAQVAAEIKSFEVEIAGIERGIEALLEEALPQVARRFNEGWSPTPILGYRLWAMSDAGLSGVRTLWDGPVLVAECPSTSDTHEVPHSDGRCGRLGCGIYVAKNPASLLAEFAPALSSSFAAGLVALDGKVVEHERGYRGARATVLSLVAVDRMRVEMTSDDRRIRRLFGAASMQPDSTTYEGRKELFKAIVSYLTDQERSQNPWTSANRNESSK